MTIWRRKRTVQKWAAELAEDIECARCERRELQAFIRRAIEEREHRLRALEEQEALMTRRWRQLRDTKS